MFFEETIVAYDRHLLLRKLTVCAYQCFVAHCAKVQVPAGLLQEKFLAYAACQCLLSGGQFDIRRTEIFLFFKKSQRLQRFSALDADQLNSHFYISREERIDKPTVCDKKMKNTDHSLLELPPRMIIWR